MGKKLLGMSQSEYARWRQRRMLPGRTRSTVSAAIKSGRISTLADGSIDPAIADREWEESADESKRTGEPGPGPPPDESPSPPESPPSVDAAADAVDFSSGTMTFQQARTIKEVLAAATAKLRYAELKGTLINRRRATDSVYGLARRERDDWLQWPARVAAEMAAALGGKLDAQKFETVLLAAVRDELARRSKIVVDWELDQQEQEQEQEQDDAG